MATGHDLRTEFHEELDAIRTDLARLAANVTELVPRATQIMLDADLEGAEYVILGDDEYDRAALDIEHRAFTLIALQAPVAQDLRELVAAIKIVYNVERSADLCANICKAARRIYSHELDAPLRGLIQKLGNQASLVFKAATEAYLESDATRAAAVEDMDGYLDGLHAQFIQVIFESHAQGHIDLQVAVQLGAVARFYERIGDHAVSVSERTRYAISGWLPDKAHTESDNPFPSVDEVAGAGRRDE